MVLCRYWSSLALALSVLFGVVSYVEAAVTASITGATLTVQGDAGNNTITLRLVAGDPTRMEVLDGAGVIGTFQQSAFTTILVQSQAGSDTILLSRVNGEITKAATLDGGPGIDTITGGGANDIIHGGTENDRLIWNPGDGDDVLDGDDGTADIVEVNGNNGAEVFAVTANGTRVRVQRNVAAVTLDIGTTEAVFVNMLGGVDAISCIGNLASLTELQIDGGSGDDTILGGNGADRIIAGDGNDTVDGNLGFDTIFAGAGNDLMIWDPGDGSDILEGQAGTDTMRFNGSAANEIFEAAANGGRVRFTRNLGNILMDLDDVEIIEVNALGGIDRFEATNLLAGTDLTTLIIDGGEGDDTLFGSELNDIIKGGGGVDIIDGRDGHDTITPGPGDEVNVQGGLGNDTLIWQPGDGTDTLEAGGGTDKIILTLTDGNDTALIQTDGVRVGILVTVPGVSTIDVGSLEGIELSALGGDDRVNVGLGFTGVAGIGMDLGAGADRLVTYASSTVVANGGADNDQFIFDAQNQTVATTPSTVATGGVTRLTHVNFEVVSIDGTPTSPPTLSIASPTTNPTMTATTPFITLAGTATDRTGIASVTWASNRGGSGNAEGTTSWSVPNVALATGVNVLTVTVTDTSGNQASDILTVTVNVLSYTMAEGATGGFFDTDILLANPNGVVAPITITYLKGDGTTVTQTLDLPATSRTTIGLDGVAGLENAEVSTTVTSNNALPLVVERTMRWDATGYGAHTERATDAPATTWYFAEGSQGFFQTFVLLANPGAVSNDTTITFLLEGGAPVVKTFTLAPTSRQTIDAGAIPELLNQSFGIIVSFTQPGVAERAMYFSTPGTPIFNAGHESAGVNTPSTAWFLAEGATGSFFTTFVLLANPGISDATATVTFLPASGAPVTKTHSVSAGQRLTLNIAAEDPSLADNAVATRVVATQPILVERAQYWPFTPDRWYEAHNSFGGTALGTKWGLAEGRVGGPQAYQTYILLANAHETQTANVTITFLRTNGTIVTKNVSVTPSSRVNVHVNSMVPELSNESFGAVVQVTSGPGIFVERALYSDANGVVFAAGTNALATRLP